MSDFINGYTIALALLYIAVGLFVNAWALAPSAGGWLSHRGRGHLITLLCPVWPVVLAWRLWHGKHVDD